MQIVINADSLSLEKHYSIHTRTRFSTNESNFDTLYEKVTFTIL